MKRLLPCAAALLLSLPARSAEAPKGVTGEASLGVLSTSGNTDTRSVNGKLGLGYRHDRWSHAGTAAAITAQQNDLTTDERYQAGYKLSYDFNEHDYAFASLDFDNDRFAGIAERTTEAVGYGRRLLTSEKHQLDVEIGAGATQIKQAEPAGRETSAVGLLNGKYQWQITETSKFTQSLKVEHSRTTTFYNPVSELKLTVAGNLFATLGYEIRHNTEVPAGTRKTDTLASVNLGYGFGAR
jgi:putative salt-induced outer membrane protein